MREQELIWQVRRTVYKLGSRLFSPFLRTPKFCSKPSNSLYLPLSANFPSFHTFPQMINSSSIKEAMKSSCGKQSAIFEHITLKSSVHSLLIVQCILIARWRFISFSRSKRTPQMKQLHRSLSQTTEQLICKTALNRSIPVLWLDLAGSWTPLSHSPTHPPAHLPHKWDRG